MSEPPHKIMTRNKLVPTYTEIACHYRFVSQKMSLLLKAIWVMVYCL